jgi:hypothetical protein
VAGGLAQLRDQTRRGDRASARTLVLAQTSVRLIERLLTLRVVGAVYEAAIAAADDPAGSPADDGNAGGSDPDDEE